MSLAEDREFETRAKLQAVQQKTEAYRAVIKDALDKLSVRAFRSTMALYRDGKSHDEIMRSLARATALEDLQQEFGSLIHEAHKHEKTLEEIEHGEREKRAADVQYGYEGL